MFKIRLIEIRERRASHPESLYPLWLEGVALNRLGERRRGLDTLEQALDRHPFPGRAKRSYRRRLTELEGIEDVSVIEADRLLIEASLKSRPQDWFLDWCHPTPAGHALIAQAILDALRAE